MVWDNAAVERLKAARLLGLSYRRIAKLWGVSRMAIAGGVHRYINGDRTPVGGKNYRRKGAYKQPAAWTETALTEPYAARKMRRQAAGL